MCNAKTLTAPIGFLEGKHFPTGKKLPVMQLVRLDDLS